MRSVLDKLGISAKYNGYHMLKIAVQMAVEDEDRLTNIARSIYPALAQKFHTDTKGVYKSIGRAVNAFWLYGNQELYDEISGYHVEEKPNNKDFITTLATYALRHPSKEEQKAARGVAAAAGRYTRESTKNI